MMQIASTTKKLTQSAPVAVNVEQVGEAGFIYDQSVSRL